MLEKMTHAAATLAERIEAAQAGQLVNGRALAAQLLADGAMPADLAGAILGVTAAVSQLEDTYGESLRKWDRILQAVEDDAELMTRFKQTDVAPRLAALHNKQVLVLDELNELRRQLLAIAATLP